MSWREAAAKRIGPPLQRPRNETRKCVIEPCSAGGRATPSLAGRTRNDARLGAVQPNHLLTARARIREPEILHEGHEAATPGGLARRADGLCARVHGGNAQQPSLRTGNRRRRVGATRQLFLSVGKMFDLEDAVKRKRTTRNHFGHGTTMDSSTHLRRSQYVGRGWCERGESNPQGLSATGS